VIYTSYYITILQFTIYCLAMQHQDVSLLKADKYCAKIHKTYYRRIKTEEFILKNNFMEQLE
jgi:hypothetical protein